MASTPDGPRYVASLQDVTDTSCYKDFFEGEVFEEAKAKAEEAADKHQRSTLVYDRKLMAITHKKVIEKAKTEVEKPVPPRRGRKKGIERKGVIPDGGKTKKVTTEDYF